MWTDSSHNCFNSRVYWRTVFFSVLNRCSVSCESCYALPSYAQFIWSLAAEWRICCWSGPPAWSSLFLWSHISQDMSHSFWMSADVHCLLDLWDCTWLQIFSCWFHQYCKIHPSNSLSQPMRVCSSPHGVDVHVLGWLPPAHAARWVSRVSHTFGSVPCALSHCFKFSKLVVHCCLALGAGHCMICCLSSVSSWHQGHFDEVCCPHHCMFFPWANCLVICFEPHHLLCTGTSCNDLSIAYRSSSSISRDKLGIFSFQYALAGGPLSAVWMSHLGCLAVHLLDSSRCHGLYGSW